MTSLKDHNKLFKNDHLLEWYQDSFLFKKKFVTLQRSILNKQSINALGFEFLDYVSSSIQKIKFRVYKMIF